MRGTFILLAPTLLAVPQAGQLGKNGSAGFTSLNGDLALPCTDDSDCTPLGHKFGCFLYRCVFLPHLSYPTASPDTPVTSPSSPGA